MYFLELSHAPPALDIIMASIIPEAIAPPRSPTRQRGPTRKPTAIGARTAQSPGRTISSIEDLVEISTHLADSHLAVPSMRPSIYELAADFFDNGTCRLLNGQHSKRSKEEGK